MLTVLGHSSSFLHAHPHGEDLALAVLLGVGAWIAFRLLRRN